MAVFLDRAVVLRTHKLGEADRIITLLTANNGLRRAVARGVRKTASRFGGRLEPFSVVEAQFYEGRNLDNITQVEAVNLYGVALCQDYDAYTAASAICETAAQLTEADGSHAHYQLVVGALGALYKRVVAPHMLLASYLLRALTLAGWGVQLRQCVVCETPGMFFDFSVAMGGVLCPACVAENVSDNADLVDQRARVEFVVLERAQLVLFDALNRGAWELVNDAAVSDSWEVYRLVRVFAQWHLEKRLRALSL